MTKTSHKKNRPFDFKLIGLVEPYPVLYLRQIPGMSTFEIMKTKNKIWQEIAEQMGYPVQFCLSRWNNLRGQFQKELKHSNELCPKSGIIRGSTWPYLERLRFLECTVQAYKPKKEKLRKRKTKEISDVIQENEAVWDSDDSSSKFEGDMEDNDLMHDLADNVQQSNPLDDSYEDSYAIIEEIAEEVVGTEEHIEIEESSIENYRKIQSLLLGFEGESLERIERRLMAFLCKCQLRSLSHQGVEDLFV